MLQNIVFNAITASFSSTVSELKIRIKNSGIKMIILHVTADIDENHDRQYSTGFAYVLWDDMHHNYSSVIGEAPSFMA